MSSSYTLIYREAAIKYLEKQDAKTQERLKNGLEGLKEIPRRGDIKKLENMEGYRLRVGDYRIRFAVDKHDSLIYINSIAHRKDAYWA
jgi:mRNA interferase RelE/StbE